MRINGRHLLLVAAFLVAVAVGYGVAWLHYNAVAVTVVSQGGRPFDPVDLAFIRCAADTHTFPRCEVRGPENMVSPDNVVVATSRDPDPSDLFVGFVAGAATFVLVGSAAFVIGRSDRGPRDGEPSDDPPVSARL